MEFTPNLNLPKPADGEDGWGDEYRAMVDTLDAPSVWAVGADATPGMEILAGYTPSYSLITVAEGFAGAIADVSLETGLGIRAVYDRAAAFGGGYAPSVYGATVLAEYDPAVGTTDVNNNDLVGTLSVAVLAASASMAPYGMYGAEVSAKIESGAPVIAQDVAGISAGVFALGASPTAPWTGKVSGIKSYSTLARTGAYDFAGVRIYTPGGGGAPANLYGLLVEAQAAGTQSWNIFSAGSTTRNKLEGRVFQGAPNSAPSDADLGNGQITAYLNEAGDALTFRVRYSNATLKTGTVALT